MRDRILKETVYEAYGERFRIKGQKTAGPVRQLASIRLIPDCSGSSSAWSTASSRAPGAISSPMPSPLPAVGAPSRTGPGKLPRVSKVLKLGALKTPEEVFPMRKQTISPRLSER